MRRTSLLLAAAALVAATTGHARPRDAIQFEAGKRLVVTAPAYRLDLSRANGALMSLVDRTTGAELLRGRRAGCLWRAQTPAGRALADGCSFGPHSRNRLTYRWEAATSTLRLIYSGEDAQGGRLDATVFVRAARSSVDFRIAVENHLGRPLSSVELPADFAGSVAKAQAGYAPTYLPGVRLGPGFFQRAADDVQVYPSRWAFADYLALDIAGGHVALYSVNPAPAPIAPATIGFYHDPAGRCSGPVFCVRHTFETWIADGATWTSPPVRLTVGATAQQTIQAYRTDNAIDGYPSLAAKLGPRLDALARAPEIKADIRKGLRPFAEWAPYLARLPSPALLHPVAYQPGGHDATDPDFLPPDPLWGGDDAFASMVAAAHGRGQLVMPYVNVSWWTPQSPTLQHLPPGTTADDLAVKTSDGRSVQEPFSAIWGYVVSPFAPFVRTRVDELMQQWRDDVPVDCVFFDQLGARKWIRDFDPAAPTPLAYEDGWIALLAPYADRCLMVEDGWDRLAQSFDGFHGSALLMDREFQEPTTWWGAGNWEPYPLADWLLHDKVLLYQHDLYDGTFTTDLPTLTWNLEFGFVLSYSWDEWQHTLDSPWLGLVGALQRALGPRYVGQPLTTWDDVAPEVTRSVFGDLTVLANHGAATFASGGYGIASNGFLARTADGSVLAGAFADSFVGATLSPGTHVLVVERSGDALAVRQPLGDDTDLAVEAPAGWSEGHAVRVDALDASGAVLGGADATVRDGRVEFRYTGTLGGARVDSYRITLA